MNYDNNFKAWQESQKLTKSFWDSYQVLFKTSSNVSHSNPQEEPEEEPNLEYLNFIEITRKHQLERDKQKQLELEKKDPSDEYYLDVSQINTLVSENLNETPFITVNKQANLKKLYGPQYESIRSMEHYIDETFKTKFQQLSPSYWPSLPINIKHYLEH